MIPAAHLLDRFHKSAKSALIFISPWRPEKTTAALKWGSHSSLIKGIDFLRYEYADIVEKQKMIVLPVKILKSIFGLRLSLLGLVPQRGQQDYMIFNYSYFDLNQDTLKIVLGETM